MKQTAKAPNVSLQQFKRTKIIATTGPASNSYEKILAIIQAGANGIRLNFSYGSSAEREQQIKWIRKASKECNKPIAIIQDLQGPKIRLGDFNGIINVAKGQGLGFKFEADYSETGLIPVQYDISKKVKRGERIYIYDGKIKTTVTSVKDGVVRVTAENPGILIKRKGMNLPDTDFGGDIITPKDRADLLAGSTQDIDYVAMSFVQTADDIVSLKKLLKAMNSHVRVIAKIETRAAVDNIVEIVQESDAVMIARGDLAVETSAESVPIVQRRIIGLGQKYAKPTIVATQMLAYMTDTPEPTRAEVSDVATAVIVGADCVMLSDETAIGSFPVESVKMMKKVILYTEANAPLTVSFPDNEDNSAQTSISKAIISLAKDIKANAVVLETKSGATAYHVSSLRSNVPLIAVTNDSRTVHQLALAYGVKSYLRPMDNNAASKLTDWLRRSKLLNKGDIVVTASGRHPGVVGTTDTIKVRMLE